MPCPPRGVAGASSPRRGSLATSSSASAASVFLALSSRRYRALCLRVLLRPGGGVGLPGADDGGRHQGQCYQQAGGQGLAVALGKLRHRVDEARGGSRHRLIVEVALDRLVRARSPTRSVACGPSPSPSSRSSRGRRATSSASAAGRHRAAWRVYREPQHRECSRRVDGLSRHLIADLPAEFVNPCT